MISSSPIDDTVDILFDDSSSAFDNDSANCGTGLSFVGLTLCTCKENEWETRK